MVFADEGNNRIMLIDLNNNTVVTIAGNGENFHAGDGGMAVDASFHRPRGVAYDSEGNLYFTAIEYGSQTISGHIRKVDPSGRISLMLASR